ncbi:GMC family oxidoreductase [Falsirhodobacter sp. 20TX0035]|uniref:GMC family oxidoreductase n=1 Tax=Falsirhodobacter sp. 20TX0035 TaxID=3022019 RepID=UPI002330155D|nr:GMC family oxidoreductase [Falsirhodobacter sp. 20TX0035]MDB6455096.1 GMC family oxidoreductase [Falsirhodobacter sp. 20TX0035]
MNITNEPVDAVVVGLGWTGAIMAIELAKAGLRVRALERGPDRPNAEFAYPKPADELAYAHRHKIMQSPRQAGFTVRRTRDETAQPMRVLGKFRLGDGVGGSGLHWTAVQIRPTPTDLKLKTFVDEHYAPGALDEELQIQNYPVSWDEIEPHMDFFDRVTGTSGEDGKDPFEGPRTSPYPLPALKDTLNCAMFRGQAEKMGYHPFSNPSAAVSQAYTNPYGQQIAPCNYCGYCSFYACLNYSKASPQTTILDTLNRMPNYDYLTGANVTKVELHPDGKTARGVTYVDNDGNEVFQPADIVILASFSLNNVRLMLNSKIGQQYDPLTGEGTVGRNYAYQLGSGYTMFFKDKEFNPFVAAGPTGVMFNDFGPGNFDSSQLGFVGGAKVHSSQATGNPISMAMMPGSPKWGPGFNKALKDSYGHSMAVKMTISNVSTRGNYLDLDPTYKDPYGMPMLRMTYDYPQNDLRLAEFLNGKVKEIVDALGPDMVVDGTLTTKSRMNYTAGYSSTHNVGGAVMGDDPRTSAVNRYLQSWDVHNVFVPSGSAFPQNFQANPTALIGALSYWCAQAIKDRYLQNPGPLV